MAFASIEALLAAAQSHPLWEAILLSDLEDRGVEREDSLAKMGRRWEAMVAAVEGYDPTERSASGLVGGDGGKMAAATPHFISEYGQQVIACALKTGECNACMKRIVAAPTAGASGVLPAVLIPLRTRHSDEEIIRAMYVAAGFGQVIATRASISGAEGGCQAEIGSASGMVAAALTALRGGTPQQCASACAMALQNLLGLVCDPVGGLVEVPCVKRNVIGAMNAISAAEMALAGISTVIPCDEVIDTMRSVGDALPSTLRETGEGGLAATPTARRLEL